VSSDSVLSAKAVSESTLVRISKKFEMRRVRRDIINYDGATMYALLFGAGEEGEGMTVKIHDVFQRCKQLLIYTDNTSASAVHTIFLNIEELEV
jgi:hypothetical protein